LYFDGQRQVLLPQQGVTRALAELAGLENRYSILTSGVEQIDLRLSGSAVLVPFDNAGESSGQKLAERGG
jgi:hypothetical protein